MSEAADDVGRLIVLLSGARQLLHADGSYTRNPSFGLVDAGTPITHADFHVYI